MNPLPLPSAIERVAGSKSAEIVLTAVAAYAGGILAPLLPVLGKSLAADRQRARVESALASMHSTLELNAKAVEQLTDDQYRIINEAISAVFSSTSKQKLDLLHHVVVNALKPLAYGPHDAAVLSRILRDITPEEASFLARTFNFESLQIIDADIQLDKVMRTKPSSEDSRCIQGLLSLGVLWRTEGNLDGAALLQFTPHAAKLLALLRKDA